MKSFNKFLSKSSLFFYFPILLFAVVWSVYNNTLHKKFMIDDHFIYTSELNDGNLWHRLLPGSLTSSRYKSSYENSTTYRPLTKFIWSTTHRMFSNDPVKYHIFNVFVFWITGCVLFYFLFTYIKRLFLAVAATLIFCIHPFEGLMMNNLPTILVAIEMSLMLSAMIFYKLGLDTPSSRNKWHILCLLSVIASFLVHETAAAFPLLFMTTLVYGLGYRWKEAFKKATPFVLLSTLYVLLRIKFTNLQSGLLDQAIFFGLTFNQYLATFARLVAWYFAQLISPSGTVLIWTTPIIKTGTLFYIMGFVGWLIAVSRLFLLSNRLTRWGISWLAIGFLPVSLSCLFRLSDGMCLETLWLVLPSIGYFLIIAHWLDRISEGYRIYAISILGLLILSLALTSRIYNQIWSDERRYCYFALEAAPNYHSGFFWLGTAFMREGDFISARRYLPLGLDAKVYNRQIYNNLGIMDFQEKKWDSAEHNFNAAIQETPRHNLAYEYLGKIYLQRNEFVKASNIFTKILAMDPKNPSARLELAMIADQQGHTNEAINLYQENLKVIPHDGQTLLLLLRIHLSHNNKNQAVETTQDILEHVQNTDVLVAAAEILALNNSIHTALVLFEKALTIDPSNKNIYLELGKLMGNINRFDDAIQIWKQGAILDPRDTRFNQLMSEAKVLQEHK